MDAYEDADKDSIDGSEAMEDNTQNETEGDGGMFSKKKRRGARQIPRPQMNEEIRALQDRMETARQQDDEALDNAKPAVAKATPPPRQRQTVTAPPPLIVSSLLGMCHPSSECSTPLMGDPLPPSSLI